MSDDAAPSPITISPCCGADLLTDDVPVLMLWCANCQKLYDPKALGWR